MVAPNPKVEIAFIYDELTQKWYVNARNTTPEEAKQAFAAVVQTIVELANQYDFEHTEVNPITETNFEVIPTING